MSTSPSQENNYPFPDEQNINTPFESPAANLNTQGNGFNNQMSVYNNQYNQYIPQSQNIVIQPIPQNQPNYEIYNPFPNVQSLDQIPHYGITQIEQNKYKVVTAGCCFGIVLPIICILVGLGLIIGTISGQLILLLFGAIFLGAGFLVMYCVNKSFFFILGENTLEVETKTICGKSSVVYHPGEITKVEFVARVTYTRKGNIMTYYLLTLQTNNGPVNLINYGTSGRTFTNDEILYFCYIMNNHISTKMRV